MTDSARVTVTDAEPVLLVAGSGSSGGLPGASRMVRLKNVTAGAPIFVGGPEVTAADGYEWAAADPPLDLTISARGDVYGILAANAGDQDVSVLVLG